MLVGIGREGWDCKSLTSVILPQKSQSASKNTIIQTACRCLRQVTKGNVETALIWLNRENATILNKQLEKEQNTSIEELNNINKNNQNKVVHIQLTSASIISSIINPLTTTLSKAATAVTTTTTPKKPYDFNNQQIDEGLVVIDEKKITYHNDDRGSFAIF